MKCVFSTCMPYYIGVYQCGLWSVVQVCLCGDWRLRHMKCVCSSCMPCYIGVYQCGLWSVVQVCLCGDWRFVLTWLWEVVCSRGSWWRFKVLGVVFVIRSLSRLWVFSVVFRLDSGNGSVV